MKHRFILIFLFQALVTLLQHAWATEDAESLGTGSGSGVELGEDNDGIQFKKFELRFTTKHKFKNSAHSNLYLAEVCDEIVRQLNLPKTKPLPGYEHRPALADCTRSNLRLSTEKDEIPAKFKMQIEIPFSVDQDAYLQRVQEHSSFFSVIKPTRSATTSRQISLQELMLFEDKFLSEITSIETDKKPSEEVIPSWKPNDHPIVVVATATRPGLGTEFFSSPATLAAIVAAAVAGLFCTILCTVFVVYRMRKKDEGSYVLGEPKHKFKQEIYIPTTKLAVPSSDREFFA